MSVLDYFLRMRLYRERASEFELLAETEDSTDVRLRYRIVARHYRELAEREEKADKARMAKRLKGTASEIGGNTDDLVRGKRRAPVLPYSG
jgi:hypothetical protein